MTLLLNVIQFNASLLTDVNIMLLHFPVFVFFPSAFLYYTNQFLCVFFLYY